jgi:hypothetical protein
MKCFELQNPVSSDFGCLPCIYMAVRKRAVSYNTSSPLAYFIGKPE